MLWLKRLEAILRVGAGIAWLAAGPGLTAWAARDLSTDRPDVTESPFTVEPGRVQIEASFAEYCRDRRNPEHAAVTAETWRILPFNFRVGLAPQAELQVMVDPRVEAKTDDRDAGVRAAARGFGDVTVRAKWNFWGNDGGATALGVMPFVKVPTAKDGLGNDSVEGGIVLPFARELSTGWSLGAMTEVDVVRTAADDGYVAAWVNTVTLGRDLTKRIGWYIEATSSVGEGKPALGADTGFTYTMNDDLQLDCGVNVGLTRAADDLVLFAGFTKRI